MKYHKQLIHHDPDKGQFGDCFRTALACLLDCDSPEDVPHFFDGVRAENNEDAKRAIDKTIGWLRERGFVRVRVMYDVEKLSDVLRAVRNTAPDIPYLLTGISKNDVGHVVICCNDEIIHNPSSNDIVGPYVDSAGVSYFDVDFILGALPWMTRF